MRWSILASAGTIPVMQSGLRRSVLCCCCAVCSRSDVLTAADQISVSQASQRRRQQLPLSPADILFDPTAAAMHT